MQVNRERLLELAIQGGATIDNAERVASAWEKWVKDAKDSWPTPFDVPAPVSHSIDERMALMSPQLESLLGKLNAFSLKRTLCIENSTGKRFELAPSENNISGIRDVVMDFPIELLSDPTWREIESKNIGNLELPIDWSRPQLVKNTHLDLVVRTTGMHHMDMFTGRVQSANNCYYDNQVGSLHSDWAKSMFVYHGEIPQEQSTEEKKEAVPMEATPNADIKVSIWKSHLVMLYNFAYEQAVLTDKVEELHLIDALINGLSGK